METTIVAAAVALSLGVGSAFAQGVPAGGAYEAPNYGSQAFSNHQGEAQTHFLGQGTVFGKLFGHSNSDQATAKTPAKGG